MVQLTCGTNSISMTDRRALYTYYASLDTTAVGTLTNYTLGVPSQHTTGSGIFKAQLPIVSVTLAAGSHHVTARVLLNYNNSGNP